VSSRPSATLAPKKLDPLDSEELTKLKVAAVAQRRSAEAAERRLEAATAAAALRRSRGRAWDILFSPRESCKEIEQD